MSRHEKLSKKESKEQIRDIKNAGVNLHKDFQTINKTVKGMQDDLAKMGVVFTDDKNDLHKAIDITARQEISTEQEKEHKNAQEIIKEAQEKKKTLDEGNAVSKRNLETLKGHLNKFKEAKLGAKGLESGIKSTQDTIQETDATSKEVENNRQEFQQKETVEYQTTEREKMRVAQYGAGVDYHQHVAQTKTYQRSHRG